MEKEIRNTSNQIKRTDNESRTVEGLAIVFNSPSVDMGFVEVIEPSAINNDTILTSDVFAYLDHNENRGVLARCKYGKGSLDLWIADDGLHYRFEAPNTQLGDELLSYLSRGEITASSFAFTIAEDGDKWERDAEGVVHRTITKIDRLFDVSPVFTPAYEATSAAKRKLDKIQQLDEKFSNILSFFDK